jgi:hypothetical protein
MMEGKFASIQSNEVQNEGSKDLGNDSEVEVTKVESVPVQIEEPTDRSDNDSDEDDVSEFERSGVGRF